MLKELKGQFLSKNPSGLNTVRGKGKGERGKGKGERGKGKGFKYIRPLAMWKPKIPRCVFFAFFAVASVLPTIPSC
ncbi:hypothetical protein VF14_32410 [Nostoc linckia z18]|uniref:Uncharacterized protein n=2 Tax=Nostoc linckia TaxID=92942 RepID=A0A9Q5Z6C5_NOSLI|nr:hypothetical protein VF03_35730 [Nostoc linckia z2]PHJ62468.1 hypothetical protein VF02_17560 [Nostoc linckia z1]PHJ71573.1 hypothetical protein VF05_05950 [Nostoc linckia z3]PHJ73054.1 hypothetical protein VF06_36315 [Nostoc linckia z4]PHJ77115.1 hypothetical protein VF07_36305 [Nostoc linckia z6]PHJ92945.1 hypothetical protein VF04_27595 [Nostoc linckia z7]PHJ95883.1 hypothetical protein VF08_31185 [Nostoc linckia z8]PHK11631.1 hypothetical protein VF09_06370 [Nostoc linckia z9]PHK1430